MPPGLEITITIILTLVTSMAHLVAFLLWQQIRSLKIENLKLREWQAGSDRGLTDLTATIRERQSAIVRTATAVEEIQRNYASKDDVRRVVEELRGQRGYGYPRRTEADK